jgi:hypothetical protein
MAENLKNTVLIDGTEYNINAIRSATADKVAQPLQIKSSGASIADFDGSQKVTIDYVSAEGGTFSGPVYLNNPSVNPAGNELVTSDQIDNRVEKLQGSPVCTWNPSGGLRLCEVKNSEDQIEKLTTIVGASEDFEDLRLFARPVSTGLGFNSNSGTITGIGTCTDTEILIPTEVDSKAIKSIGGSAFNPTTNSGKATILNAIKSVVIPYGIENIGDSAFKNCAGLAYVSIPESVKILGAKQDSTIFYGCSALSIVRLCYGLETIGASTFYNCGNLEKINIPSSVRTIGSQAFYGCAKLKDIEIPNGISTIEHSTFNKCSNLKSVYIPNTVTEIRYNAFSGCDSLASIVFGGTAAQWKAMTKGNDWDYHTGYNYSNKTSTSYIYYNVYCTDKYLTKAGTGSTEYTESAYSTYNEKMTHYTVTTSNTISSLGVAANATQNLLSVTIPSTIKTINANVFSACSNLVRVYYAGSLADWNKINIESGNDNLLKAKLIALTDTAANGTINTADVVNGPFMYICRDMDSGTMPAANKVFLKLSTSDDIIEISKGATRLDSTIATSQSCYTYESLAEIIAKINTRLDALGIPVTTTVLAPDAPLTVEKVNELIPNVEITSDIVAEEIPDIKELGQKVNQLNTNITNITSGETVAKKALQDNNGRQIDTGYYQSVNTNVVNKITISTEDPTPTAGNIGDIWIKYE